MLDLGEKRKEMQSNKNDGTIKGSRKKLRLGPTNSSPGTMNGPQVVRNPFFFVPLYVLESWTKLFPQSSFLLVKDDVRAKYKLLQASFPTLSLSHFLGGSRHQNIQSSLVIDVGSYFQDQYMERDYMCHVGSGRRPCHRPEGFGHQKGSLRLTP